MRAYYDLHIHSCLSPCGDKDMTPNNIIGMCKLSELDAVALTDHNSCKNCPAAAQVAEQYGICFIPGMELTTSEEIHAVCLFPTLEQAMAFDSYVVQHQMQIPNREDIYGEQPILDSQDQTTGKVENLLVLATDISIMDAGQLVKQYGGVCFPAHIDRQSYSILSSLGDIPPECGFTTIELADHGKLKELLQKYPAVQSHNIVVNSDAHYLENMKEKDYFLEVDAITPTAIIEALKRKL